MELATQALNHSSGPSALAGLARLVAGRLKQAGIDPQPLLAQAGLLPSSIAQLEARVPVKAHVEFLNLAAYVLQDKLLGFHIARDSELRELGALYYIMASAPTLGEALAREQRYSWMVNEGIRTSCRLAETLAIDVEHDVVQRHLGRHEMEFWLTCTVRKCRVFTERNLIPIYVGFEHQRGPEFAEMDRYFGLPPTFGAPHNRICFQKSAADLPQVTADPYLGRLFTSPLQAERRAERLPDRLRMRVEKAIGTRLPHGTAQLDAIAEDLGMSPRTLARRLSHEGESFSDILDGLRSVLATYYLGGRELSISQIAWLLGYREASSLVRAVKRWTGKLPREVRRETVGKAEETSENRS